MKKFTLFVFLVLLFSVTGVYASGLTKVAPGKVKDSVLTDKSNGFSIQAPDGKREWYERAPRADTMQYLLLEKGNPTNYFVQIKRRSLPISDKSIKYFMSGIRQSMTLRGGKIENLDFKKTDTPLKGSYIVSYKAVMKNGQSLYGINHLYFNKYLYVIAQVSIKEGKPTSDFGKLVSSFKIVK